MPIGLVMIALAATPSPVALGTDESDDNRIMVQAFLDRDEVKGLEIIKTKETRDALLVVPFVPKGTRFKSEGRVWKSIPWMTRAQRDSGNYLEISSLYRRRANPDDTWERASLWAFFRPENINFSVDLESINRVWKITRLEMTLE